MISTQTLSALLCCCLITGCRYYPAEHHNPDSGQQDAGSHAVALPVRDVEATTGAQGVSSEDGGHSATSPQTQLDAGGSATGTSSEPEYVDAGAPSGVDSGSSTTDTHVDPPPVDSTSADSDPEPPVMADAAAPPPVVSDPIGTTEPEPVPGIDTDALFARDGIARIELTVPDAGVEALQLDPFTYVEGDVEVELADGTQISLPRVGVRQKGFIGSRRALFDKPSFLIKTNEYVKGRDLLGMKKLALNNMVQDPSAIHEQLAYDLFRALDVPAPRTSYARVTLNGGPVALYASVEVIDGKDFLQKWFGNDDGNLYEGEYGVDVVSEAVESFDLDRGEDVAFADLQELASALEAMNDPQTLLTDIAQRIDIERYVRFAAAERFMAHWDGYAEGRNNYFLYRAPGGLWTWLPWGTDQTFEHLEAVLWNQPAVVQQLCEGAQPCRSKLGEAYQLVTAKAAELDLLGRCDQLEALIRDALAEDALLEYTLDQALAAIEAVREFLRQRPARIESQLVCVDPSTVDHDGDGSSGCGEDCNDEDALIYAGAPERCNVIDDDCDGELDDNPMCPTCIETSNEGEPHYAFCFVPHSWSDAADDCIGRGGRLVSVHGQAQADALRVGAGAILYSDWWIGLNDLSQEGNFVWEDQSGVDYANWGEGEPNNAGESEHCANMRGEGFWNDLDCGTALNYICQLP